MTQDDHDNDEIDKTSRNISDEELQRIIEEERIADDEWNKIRLNDTVEYHYTLGMHIAKFPMPKRNPEDKKDVGISAKTLANHIFEQIHIAKTANETLFYYKDGIYKPHGREAIEELLYQIVNHGHIMCTVELCTAVVKFITIKAPLLWEKPLDDKINVLNGIIDCRVSPPVLLPHAHQYLSVVQLPIEYDENACCYGMEKFVSETFPEDAQHLPWEIMAWVITSCNRVQKMIILNGAGSNGKSTFLNAIQNLLGKDNVSHVSLQRLENNRFASSGLYQKLANICADLPVKKLENTMVFKSITGGDRVEIEIKGKPSFPVVLFSKLLFSTNELPHTADNSDGFYRKIDIIPFEASFEANAEKAEQLADMVADPNELSGMLNRALEFLPGVMKRGIRMPESVKYANKEYRRFTDPIAKWIDDNIEAYGAADNFISSEELYERYKEGTKIVELKSKDSFSKAFRKLAPYAKSGVKRFPDGIVKRGWLGVKLRELNLTIDQ